jgi:RNA polymerase sigma factor (sigma-70 family)
VFAGHCAPGASDAELLGRFVAAGEDAAFAALVQCHGPMVLGVCRRVLRDAHAAEDAFQATFLVLVRKAASLDRSKPLANWLYTVAYRLALRARSTEAQRRLREQKAAALRPEVSGSVLPGDLCAVLDEELQRLPLKHRTPLVLCYLQGKTNEQAARELGCPTGSMAWRLARARELLRERLRARGLLIPATAFVGVLTGQTLSAAVPPWLWHATTRAALGFLAGDTMAARLASPRAVALANGGLKAMTTTRLYVVTTLALVLGVLGGAAALHVCGQAGKQPPSAQPDAKPPQKQVVAEGDGDKLPAKAVARLGSVRFRHGDTLLSVAYTPDGKFLVTTGKDLTVRVWDVASGKELYRVGLPNEEAPLEIPAELASLQLDKHVRAAVSPDGKLLVTALGGVVTVRELSGGKELHRLRGRLVGSNALAFTADSKAVLLAGMNGSLERWDASTGKTERLFDGPADVLEKGLAFTAGASVLSSDGTVLARLHHDPNKGVSIQLRQVPTGKDLPAPALGAGGALNLTFSPDGQTLAFGSYEGNVYLWDRTGKAKLRARRRRRQGFPRQRPRLQSRRQDPGREQTESDGPSLGRRVRKAPPGPRRSGRRRHHLPQLCWAGGAAPR